MAQMVKKLPAMQDTQVLSLGWEDPLEKGMATGSSIPVWRTLNQILVLRRDWFQIGKGVCQGCILLPCLFNLYAEYIMQNSYLDEAQAWIKIARRNINNLRYADDTTLMAENE